MKKKPSLSLSVFVLLMIAAVLTCGIVAGIATIPLLVVNLFLVLIVSMIAGYSYRQLEAGMMDGVKRAIDCVLILVFVGVLIAAWISCGTVPMIIYYGLGVITPRLVLPFTFLICALLSTCIGISLGTAGTAGVACVSIGVSMGIPIELLAGAAISGSILGDKLSPLSDSTILASSASDINIYHHVRSMIYATLPAFLVSLGAFYLLGARYAEAALDKSTLDAVRATLAELYDFRLVLLLPVVLIVVLCLKKVPAILAILISGFSGLALSVFVQGTPIPQVISIIYDGVKVETGVSIVNEMLSKGGITSMMATICTAVLALGLGGILSEAGYLHAVVEAAHLPRKLRYVHRAGHPGLRDLHRHAGHQFLRVSSAHGHHVPGDLRPPRHPPQRPLQDHRGGKHHHPASDSLEYQLHLLYGHLRVCRSSLCPLRNIRLRKHRLQRPFCPLWPVYL